MVVQEVFVRTKTHMKERNEMFHKQNTTEKNIKVTSFLFEENVTEKCTSTIQCFIGCLKRKRKQK